MQFRAYRMRLKNEHVMDYEHVHKKGQIWNSVITGMKKAGSCIKSILLVRKDELKCKR